MSKEETAGPLDWQHIQGLTESKTHWNIYQIYRSGPIFVKRGLHGIQRSDHFLMCLMVEFFFYNTGTKSESQRGRVSVEYENLRIGEIPRLDQLRLYESRLQQWRCSLSSSLVHILQVPKCIFREITIEFFLSLSTQWLPFYTTLTLL